MPVSVGMKTHLAQSATTLCRLWRVEERRREVLVNFDTASRTGVTARGGYLRKSGTTEADDAGAFASHALTGDGYLRFLARLDGTVMCGLSSTDADETEDTIEYAIRVEADGTITVVESGSEEATAATTARKGDWFYIKRIGSAITYYHNRTLIYTSLLTDSGSLYADASITTPEATLWQVSYGTIPAVITATDHTRSLTWEGETYAPLPMNPSQFVLNAGLKPDNLEISHVLSVDGFTEADLVGGRWDLARLDVTTVNYLDLSLGHARKKSGQIGVVKVDNGHFTAEVRGFAQILGQDLGETIGELCTVRRLGNFECGLDITDYMHDAEITVVTDSITFTVDLSPAQADDYFAYGSVYFRTGDNKFYEREIKGNTGNVITLVRPFPFLPEVGDDVTLIAGCARTRAACKRFVNLDNESETNIENFQGFPDIPGSEKVYKYPE